VSTNMDKGYKRRMKTAPKGGPVVAAVMLLVLAACAGNGDGVPNPTPTEPPTSSTTSTTVSDTTVTTEASTTTSTTFPEPEPSFDALRGINTVLDFADGYTSHGLRLWERSVPGVVDTTVRSTIDGD